MKKIFAALLAVALFAPASAMAQYKPNQKPSKPSYNGPVAHPGHGGIHSHPGNSGHPGYNQPSHGSNNNHNNNNNHGHPGYNPGHSNNHGHPGHHAPIVIPELMQAHRAVSRAFRTVENSYFPIFMSKQDKMKMGRAIGKLSNELKNMARYVGPKYRSEIREISTIVERAKFTMFSENDVRAAYKKIQRAERRYNRIADNFFRR